MARSGTLRSNTVGEYNYGLAIDWSIKSQSISNNSSEISYKIYGISNSSNAWAEYKNISVSIEGNNVYSTSSYPNVRSGTVIKSGTITIPHNQDGYKNVLFNLSAYVWGSGNININKNVTLNKIDRGIENVKFGTGWDKLTGDKTITFNKLSKNAVVKATYQWFDYSQNKRVKYWYNFKNNNDSIYNSGDKIDLSNRHDEIKTASFSKKHAWLYIKLEVYIGDNKIQTFNINKDVNLEAKHPTLDVSFDRKGYGFDLIKSNEILNNQHKLIIKSTPKAYDGASIKDTYIEFQGVKKRGTTAEFISTKNGVHKVNVVTKDTRGYTASKSITIQVLKYQKPTLEKFSSYRYRGSKIDISGSDVKIKGVIVYDTTIDGNVPMWKIEPASTYTETKDILHSMNLPVSESKTLTLIWGDAFVGYKRIITINKSEFPLVVGKKSVGINYFPTEEDEGLFVSAFGGNTDNYVGKFDGYIKSKGINHLKIEDTNDGVKISNYTNSKGLGLLLKKSDIYYVYDKKEYSLWPAVKNNASDIRLKKNIKSTNHKAMDIVNKLEFKEYDWKDGVFNQPHTNIGLIAQDIKRIDKSLVYEDGDILKLDLLRLINISLKGIKELQEEIKELKGEIQNEKNKRNKI